MFFRLALFVCLWSMQCNAFTNCNGVTPPLPNSTTQLSRWPYITATEFISSLGLSTATITFGTTETFNGTGFIQYVLLGKDGNIVGSNTSVKTTDSVEKWFNWADEPVIKTMVLRSATIYVPPSSRVCYKVVVGGVEFIGGLSFVAAPIPVQDPVSWTFLAYGDFGVGVEVKPWYRPESPQSQIRKAMDQAVHNASFILALGDVGYFSGKRKTLCIVW